MNHWHVYHSRGGWALRLELVRPISFHLGNTLERLVHPLTAGLVCCNIPERMWYWPVGKARYDRKDGALENSVGNLLWMIGQEAHRLLYRFNDGVKVLDIPLTPDQAQKIDPEFYDAYNDMMSPEEEHI